MTTNSVTSCLSYRYDTSRAHSGKIYGFTLFAKRLLKYFSTNNCNSHYWYFVLENFNRLSE